MEKADIHCHLLPYVDDGAYSMDIALRLLKEEAKQGVRKVCVTPHLRYRMFETPDEEIVMRFKQLNEEKKKLKIPVKLYLSREYHYDKSLLQALEEETIFPYARGVLLTEFSHSTPRSEMLEAVEKLTKLGLTPLIAHAERYREVQDDPAVAKELCMSGALIQVNAGSLLAWEGRKQKKVADRLLKSGLVFAVASDSHDMDERSPNLAQAQEYLVKYYGKGCAEKVLRVNPGRLLEG